MSSHGLYMVVTRLNPEEQTRFFNQHSFCWLYAFEALKDYIELKWKGLQVESVSDDEFEVIEILKRENKKIITELTIEEAEKLRQKWIHVGYGKSVGVGG